MAESTAAAGAAGAGGPWEWLTSLWTTQEWNMDVIALLYSRYTGYLVVFVLVDFFMLFCVPGVYSTVFMHDTGVAVLKLTQHACWATFVLSVYFP